MRVLNYILIFLLSLSFVAQAQTREDIDTQSGRVALAKSVHIFPNPAVDFVHVRLEQVPVENLKLTVHNIIGNQVSVETEIVDEHEVRVRVKDLNSGYYLLAIKDDEDKFQGTYKFLKR